MQYELDCGGDKFCGKRNGESFCPYYDQPNCDRFEDTTRTETRTELKPGVDMSDIFMKKTRFAVGDYVVFDTETDYRYEYLCLRCATKYRFRQCCVTEVSALGFYNLMELDADSRRSAGHHLVSERCLTLMVNPPID